MRSCRQKSFENQEEFLNLLKNNRLLDHATLRQISQHVTSQPSLFTDVGTIFLDYLIDSIPHQDNLIKLNCINTYYLPCLANFPSIAQETRLKIFRYCLKVRLWSILAFSFSFYLYPFRFAIVSRNSMTLNYTMFYIQCWIKQPPAQLKPGKKN